jgi:hypothetical protein
MVEGVYKRSARLAAGTRRTAPALKRLKWDKWFKRRSAKRVALVMRIKERHEPEALWGLFLGPVQREVQLRCMTAGEIEENRARTSGGTKALSFWAPEIHNQVKRGEALLDEEEGESE